jgi:hypothetical protein
VTEQHLNGAQVGTKIQEVYGERMTKPMWMDALRYAQLTGGAS